jgi:hypothetical protein
MRLFKDTLIFNPDPDGGARGEQHCRESFGLFRKEA